MAHVRISPIPLLPGVLEKIRRDGVSLHLVAPCWLARIWFLDIIVLLAGIPWEIPHKAGPALANRGPNSPPAAGAVEAMGLGLSVSHSPTPTWNPLVVACGYIESGLEV